MKKLNEDLWVYNTRDLMRAASCNHCIKLAIARELEMPGVAELVSTFETEVKGLPVTYGNKFESDLEAELRESLSPADFQRPEGKDPWNETITLMQQGVAVIYQGALRQRIDVSEFSGRPDFLVRADHDLIFIDGLLRAEPSAERQGAQGYIAWDAKLASSAKPQYLLQVALYVDALEAVGQKADAKHGLILGSRKLVTFEEGEIVPAMRQARSYLLAAFEALSRGGSTANYELKNLALHCETSDSCKVCEYPGLCSTDRVHIDHLVQVANINKSQIEKLRKAGISTMAQLAEATDQMRPTDFVQGTFDKLRLQASLQTNFKNTGKHSFTVLEDPEIGVLPPSSPGDMFFDMEGFSYFEERGGLEYLFGAVTIAEGASQTDFHEWWAHDRYQERLAFEGFVTFAHAQMLAYPEAHIYHYAPYEVSALTKLSARHGSMEAEVAWLINEDKLIDLYKVVKGSIMVSQPSYSIKKLEVFYDFARKSTVVDAGSSIEEYDSYRQIITTDPAAAELIRDTIGVYNEDDCVSTWALYNWLSGMPGAHSKYAEFRGAVAAKKAFEKSQASHRDDSPEARRANKAELELDRLNLETEQLKLAVEDWPWGLDEDADYRARIWLALTHSMLYYNREEVIKWRDWRLRKDSTDDALHRDRKALVVEGCELTSDLVQFLGVDARSNIKIEYSYQLQPGQTNFLKAGQKIFVRFNLGANQQDTEYGEVVSIHANQLVFRRNATAATSLYEPNAIFENEWIPLADKPKVVGDWVKQATERWGSPTAEAPIGHPTLDLLMRRKPRLLGGKALPIAEPSNYLPAVIEAIELLDHSVLAVQGPPGSGKTYLASHAIAHLIKQGKSVGVTANSHSAVQNLLQACLAAGVAPTSIAKRNGTNDRTIRPWASPKDNADLASWRLGVSAEGHVVGGTSWNFTSQALLQQTFDYIFIDEAAQFSLVDAIAVGHNAKNIILLGDPQQLTQVVQALHPGGVDNSALGHYMGEQQILDPEHGYFVEVTRRMHPEVNEPVSWLAYQGRLRSHPDASTQCISGVTPGFTAVPVEHFGNSSHSPEEVEVVVSMVQKHLSKVSTDEILVVAPYNAQVDSIRDALDAVGLEAVQVGTVDKFQGREAMIVIISLAASTAEDAPRGLDFLLDRNRLNVALSRAKTNSYLVYSPSLVRTRFTNIEDLKSVSRLAGLLEFAN